MTDGDTILVSLGGREEFVRFIGIDTPETFPDVDCGGPEASASMERLVQPGDRVKLVRDATQGNRDTYDRLLRYVEVNGRDLGLVQASRGWAEVFVFDRPFRRLGDYERAEAKARASDKGVWTNCGGFPPP